MTLYLIDGNSYTYRAFFGLPRLSNRKGQPTQAVYGLATFLLKILKEGKVKNAVVAFDPPGPTFRHEAFEQYKAQRKPAPDDLVSQFPLVRRLVELLGIPRLEREGFEADDVIATLVRRAREAGDEVVIFSGDKDILQLVGPGVWVRVPRKEDEEVGPEAVRRRWGVPPERMVELLALMGDSSDNLPGIQGVGEKTAAALLAQFPSLDALFSRLEEVKSLRLRDKLRQGRELVMRTRELAVLRDDIPLSEQEARTEIRPPDAGALREFFTELEFSSLLASVPGPAALAPVRDFQAGPPPVEVPAPDGNFMETLLDQKRVVCLKIDSFLALSSGKRRRLMPATADVFRKLARFCESPASRKIVFGLKELARELETAGVALKGVVHDAQLAAYLLKGRRQNLADAAREFLGIQEAALISEGEPAARAGRALDALENLCPALDKQVREQGLHTLLEQVEIPLAGVLARMEGRGIRLDTSILAKATEDIERELAKLESRIKREVGADFNVLSPKQVAEVLFKKLNLPSKRKTKTGFSTNESVLAELSALHPVPGMILEYRKLAKLLGTYLEPLPGYCGPDGLLRTNFNQMGAATGRISSSDPNLQNIPVRGEIGRRIRSAFLPRSKDCMLLSADYSQVELRLLAHMAQDRPFLESFSRGEDVHAATAGEMFGKSARDATPDERRAAKAVNFGIIYGMTAFGLARELKCPPQTAVGYLNRYFDKHPAVKKFWNETLKRAREKGWVATLMGRRRYLPEIASSVKARREESEREAINHPIQGTAADIMKLAMVRCAEGIPDAELLLTIHDELLFEVPRGRESELAERIRIAMEKEVDSPVPLKVDVVWGASWAECHP